MYNKHMKQSNVLMIAAFTALSASFTACSDDDNATPNSVPSTTDPAKVSFVVTANDATKSLKGGSRMKVFTDLNTTKADQIVYGDSTNANVAYSPDGFTQAKFNSQAAFYTGYIYRQGSVSADKGGLGEGKMGTRTFTYANGKLSATGQNIISNFGNVGVFSTYSYAAMNNDLTVYRFTANGTMSTWQAPNLTDYAVDGIAPVITDVMDLGNNRLALALYYSNRDSAAVAFTDYNFSSISKVTFDSRIGGVYGAWRSVRYAMGGVADDGTAYFFCGTSKTDNKIGALRIKSGESTFDTSYKFDIYTAGEGYRFRKAYPIGGSKFLLEFYTGKDAYGVMDTSGKFAIADMDAKTLTWVTGLPDPATMASLSIGYGDGYDGYYYLPVNPAEAGSSTSGGGSWHHMPAYAASATTFTQPVIYKINASTGEASVFMTFARTEQIKAINIIKQ